MSSRSVVALILAAAMAGPAASAAGPDHADQTSAGVVAASYDFRGSGFEGGGFQNTVAVGPTGTWLSGGDVAGISRSTDGGRTWAAANAGLADQGDLRVASLVYAPTSAQPQRVLAGVGYRATASRPASGGLLESVDDGRTWRVLSRAVRFSGTDEPSVGSPPRPPARITGRLVAAQPDGALLAGTYDQGVQRSADNGRTWRPVGVTGRVRSLVVHPARPTVAYAAADSGVWRSSGTGSAVSFTRLTGAPAGVEELAFVSGQLYAAAGGNGIYRIEGSRWVRLGGTTLPVDPADVPVWTSLVGYRACNRTVLYAGSQTGGADSVVRSVDGGRTWRSAVTSAVPTVGGPGGPRWWLADRPAFLLGAASYAAAQLVVPSTSGCDRPVVVAGRSGLWQSTVPGTAPWYPMVGRLGVTVVNAVAVDPRDSARTLAASFDWPLVASTDRFGSVTQFQPGQRMAGAAGLGTAVAFDTSTIPSTAYLAAGEESTNSLGEVYASTDPTDPASWVATGLGVATGGRLPFALGAASTGGSSVLLAAVQGSGLWRRAAGSWSQVLATAAFDNESRLGGSFATLADGTSFFFDLNSGLYRSAGFGAGPWQLVWSVRTTNSNGGYIAADATTPGRLYVSVGNDVARRRTPGLCRIDGASTVVPGSDGTVPCTTVVLSPRVGPLHVDPLDGSVLVTQRAGTDPVTGSVLPPQLCRSAPTGAGPWTDVADAGFRGSGGFVRSLAVGADGTAYIALAGEGVLVGVPGTGSGSAGCAGT